MRNREYWIEKIEENMAHDQRNDRALTQLGWTPIHFWEKEILKNLLGCIETIDDVALNLIVETMDMCGE